MSRKGLTAGKHTEIRAAGIMRKNVRNVKGGGKGVKRYKGAHKNKDALGGSGLSRGSGRHSIPVNVSDSLFVPVQGGNYGATGPDCEHGK